MLPEVRPRRALILGLGGGTIAHLIWRQFGPLPIVGVEANPQVVRLARSAFELDRAELEIVEADALSFVAAAEGPFDYVAVDLFEAGQIPPSIFSRPFLKTVRRLMAPGGLAAVNFFKDRRLATHEHRLESVFPRVTYVDSGKNVIARCRAR
jgi:spermidine synthase